MGNRADLIDAMVEEIFLQRDYLQGESLSTVYFGGGTPSLLSGNEIELLLHTIDRTYSITPGAEITLEANPDDLTMQKLTALKSLGINRLSIGIQSFDDSMLRYLNRAHTSGTASRSLMDARNAGFDNVSIDLIYAIPGLTSEDWKRNISKALQARPQHISAYTLTIEDKTTFGSWLSKGKLTPVDESSAAEQMEILVSELAKEGYRQYEISNFARAGFESKHNSNYWKGEKYLGIGPSAHSYNQVSRQHNVANNHVYVRSLNEKKIPAETEILKRFDRINEYILTTLRTIDGCDLAILKNNFGYDVLVVHESYLRELQRHNLVSLDERNLRLTETGRLLADKIASDLFLVE